jgi:hypothetical protein
MLAIDHSPPLTAPLRFFLTAPLHGAAAGLLLALNGEAIAATRWSPSALAAVHLLALGVLAQVIAGALLQLLPVAVGRAVPFVRGVAVFTHLGLNAGALLLVIGLLRMDRVLLGIAAPVLGITFLGYLSAVGWALLRSKAHGPTRPALRIAVLGLTVTAGLGFTLASALAHGWSLPLTALVHVHAAWGLVGFAVCVVMGVAYVVVPMFQLTPAYPQGLARAMPPAIALGACCLSAGLLAGVDLLSIAGAVLLAGTTATFAVQTLRLLARRRRRVRDATFWSWRLGLVCLLAAAAAGSWLYIGAPEMLRARLEYLTGVLVLGGAFPAFIAGMLYKILPFLVWLHLSQRGPAAPLMNEILGGAPTRAQLGVHAGALALLLAGAAWPPLVAAGGLVFAAAWLLLAANLVAAVRVYRSGTAAIAATPASP